MSYEDMENFLQTGKVPGVKKEEENLPRRTRSNRTETTATSEQEEAPATRRRTASRF